MLNQIKDNNNNSYERCRWVAKKKKNCKEAHTKKRSKCVIPIFFIDIYANHFHKSMCIKRLILELADLKIQTKYMVVVVIVFSYNREIQFLKHQCFGLNAKR